MVATSRLAPRVSALLLALALPALLCTGACSDEAEGGSSYLLIELVPVQHTQGKVTAARVVIEDDKGNHLNDFCVNLAGAQGTVVGSFVLERVATKPVNVRATVRVTGYEMVESPPAPVGKDFTCSDPPMALGDPAELSVDFCAGQAKVLRFHVGSDCPNGCDTDEACGAGIGTNGGICEPGFCCRKQTPTACGLDNAG